MRATFRCVSRPPPSRIALRSMRDTLRRCGRRSRRSGSCFEGRRSGAAAIDRLQRRGLCELPRPGDPLLAGAAAAGALLLADRPLLGALHAVAAPDDQRHRRGDPRSGEHPRRRLHRRRQSTSRPGRRCASCCSSRARLHPEALAAVGAALRLVLEEGPHGAGRPRRRRRRHRGHDGARAPGDSRGPADHHLPGRHAAAAASPRRNTGTAWRASTATSASSACRSRSIPACSGRAARSRTAGARSCSPACRRSRRAATRRLLRRELEATVEARDERAASPNRLRPRRAAEGARTTAPANESHRIFNISYFW